MDGNNFKGCKHFFFISCLAYSYYLWQDAGAKHRINLTNLSFTAMMLMYCTQKSVDVPSNILFTEYKTHYLFPSVYRQWTDRKHDLSKPTAFAT